MTDTPNIKVALRAKLKHYYGGQWAYKVAERSGYHDDYVRKYFRSTFSQPIIAAKAQELIESAKEDEKIMLKKIEQA